MNEAVFDQARRLNGAIRDLQHRITTRSLRPGLAGASTPRELTHAQLTTLTAIHERGAMNLKELAEATHVTPPSASGMIDRLSDLRLVQRAIGETDRREVRISLTPEGVSAVEHFEAAMLGSLVDLLEKLGPDAARRWCEVYDQIQDIIDTESTTIGFAEAK